ncbi:MAG: GumC family protein, partial [Ignavibacteriales bacterium]
MRPEDRIPQPYDDGRGDRVASSSYGPIVVSRPTAVGEWIGAATPIHEDGGFNLVEYWRLVLKHRFVVLGAFVGAIAIGLAYTLLTTPIYTAKTTLQIDREATKVLDMEDVTPAEMQTGDEFFQTQYGLLKSASLAQRVVDDLGLASPAFLKAMGAEAPKDNTSKAALREKAAKLVERNVHVEPVRGSRLVDVAFDSPSAQLSARVANGIADSFIESNLERRYESASYARNFLEQRLAQVKSRLEDSERQLVAYAAQQQIINVAVPASGENGGAEQTASQSLTAADLIGMNTALDAARADRIRAQERWRQASKANAASLPEVLQSPTIQALRQQKAALAAQYQDKLSVYKPDFPVMVQLKAQMDELDKQIGAETDTIRRSLQNQYQVAAQQEASLSRQVDSLKHGVMDLRNRSIQYNILQREVDTNRTLYDGLLQRYKEVGVAGGVGANNVSVVDRAQPPGKPSKP